MTRLETLKNYFEKVETKITVLPNDNGRTDKIKIQFNEETLLGTIVL